MTHYEKQPFNMTDPIPIDPTQVHMKVEAMVDNSFEAKDYAVTSEAFEFENGVAVLVTYQFPAMYKDGSIVLDSTDKCHEVYGLHIKHPEIFGSTHVSFVKESRPIMLLRDRTRESLEGWSSSLFFTWGRMNDTGIETTFSTVNESRDSRPINQNDMKYVAALMEALEALGNRRPEGITLLPNDPEVEQIVRALSTSVEPKEADKLLNLTGEEYIQLLKDSLTYIDPVAEEYSKQIKPTIADSIDSTLRRTPTEITFVEVKDILIPAPGPNYSVKASIVCKVIHNTDESQQKRILCRFQKTMSVKQFKDLPDLTVWEYEISNIDSDSYIVKEYEPSHPDALLLAKYLSLLDESYSHRTDNSNIDEQRSNIAKIESSIDDYAFQLLSQGIIEEADYKKIIRHDGYLKLNILFQMIRNNSLEASSRIISEADIERLGELLKIASEN